MLQRQPEVRPSILEILNDTWIKKTPKCTDIAEEFRQRNAYVEKLEEEALKQQVQKQAQAKAQQVPKKSMKGSEDWIDKEFYPYNNMIVTKFECVGPVEDLTHQLLETLNVHYPKAEPHLSPKKYKIKITAENTDEEGTTKVSNIAIRLLKNQNNNIFVEFQKQNGDQALF